VDFLEYGGSSGECLCITVFCLFYEQQWTESAADFKPKLLYMKA